LYNVRLLSNNCKIKYYLPPKCKTFDPES